MYCDWKGKRQMLMREDHESAFDHTTESQGRSINCVQGRCVPRLPDRAAVPPLCLITLCLPKPYPSPPTPTSHYMYRLQTFVFCFSGYFVGGLSKTSCFLTCIHRSMNGMTECVISLTFLSDL